MRSSWASSTVPLPPSCPPCRARSCGVSRRRTSPARRSTTPAAPSLGLNARASGPRSTCSARRSAARGGAGDRARPTHDVLAAIDADRLDANVSVKLTGLGLKLDLELCRSLLEGLVRDAAGARLVRPDRHGGLVVRRRHARPLPRPPRRRARQRRDRAAGVPQADARRHRGARATCARACGSARASTSSRARSRSRTPRSCAAPSSPASRRSSTAARGSGSRRTTSG